MSSKPSVLDLFLVRNSFKSLPHENYNIKDTKVYVYVIAVIVLRKNSCKFPLGASFCLMAFMYSLKTEMISRHCSTKDDQKLLYMKRERVKENNRRGSHCEINFRFLTWGQQSLTKALWFWNSLCPLLTPSPTPRTTVCWKCYCCISNMLTESKCNTPLLKNEGNHVLIWRGKYLEIFVFWR